MLNWTDGSAWWLWGTKLQHNDGQRVFPKALVRSVRAENKHTNTALQRLIILALHCSGYLTYCKVTASHRAMSEL